MRSIIIPLLLTGCVKTLPPDNYSITETYLSCDAGVCHKVTHTLKPSE
jgi:hypothetical protein